MHERGFTLIELITVIALIGILTSVVIVNYRPIRERAQLNDAQSAMQNASAIAAICVFRNSNLNTPNPLGSPTNRVCNNHDTLWPNIGQFAGGWAYVVAGFEGDVSDRAFTFSASGNGDTITCTQDGCTTL